MRTQLSTTDSLPLPLQQDEKLTELDDWKPHIGMSASNQLGGLKASDLQLARRIGALVTKIHLV